MKLVLLSGLDGTGVLFEPFLKYSDGKITTEIIELPPVESATFKDLAMSLAERLKDDELIILAESYSGRLAYELAKNKDLKINQIFFTAIFLSTPSLLSNYASFFPISLVKSRFLPKSIVGKFLFGRYSSKHLLDLFYRAMDRVDFKILKSRLRQISLLEPPRNSIEIPCTYIGALSDNLVSRRVLDTFKQCCNKLDIQEIEGTHFLLQTNPSECWDIVYGKIAL
ncbi:MAG: surfactin synthase thioesterase subunit [Gammaproteobacteria bacterium]